MPISYKPSVTRVSANFIIGGEVPPFFTDLPEFFKTSDPFRKLAAGPLRSPRQTFSRVASRPGLTRMYGAAAFHN